MKIIQIILFLIGIVFGNMVAMDEVYKPLFPDKKISSAKPLSAHVDFEPLPKTTAPRDIAIVQAIRNLFVITAEDKNYVDINPLNNKLRDFEEETNQHWDEHHKKRYGIEVLNQKWQYYEVRSHLNMKEMELLDYKMAYAQQSRELSRYKENFLEYQNKIRKETFFHRNPVITWGLGIATGLGLLKLYSWFRTS